ncbi:hypothetical protein [Nocardia ninae]|nr:hypothetical protein [Nocardia ninae]
MKPQAAERRGTVQGTETEIQLADPHPNAAVFAYKVVDVRPSNTSRVVASVTSTVDGAPLSGRGEIPFVRDGASWKIEKAWACAMLEAVGRPSPSC